MYKLNWKTILRALSPGQRSEDVPFDEHEALEEWAKQAADTFGEGSLALEIGAYKGASTAILAQFFKVITIDLWYPLENYAYETMGDNFSDFMDTYKKFDLRGRVFPLLGTSETLTGILPKLFTKFCFVDGDHSYEGAKSDLYFCDYHLADRGYLVVHDYPRAGTVERAVDEFVQDKSYDKWGCVSDGIVALRKK